ncbi:MAG: HNH endonuclease [Proteobacteria bacterium]|nr:HNH endonuclease [Pseudomonadota bacterium]
MPYKPPHTCGQPGCPNTTITGAYCARHTKPRADTRRSASERGYDRQWRRIRDAYLSHTPHCEYCGKDADVVHHIIPLPNGTHHINNLTAVCASCHKRIHDMMRANT